jgi:hypothetical protein
MAEYRQAIALGLTGWRAPWHLARAARSGGAMALAGDAWRQVEAVTSEAQRRALIAADGVGPR